MTKVLTYACCLLLTVVSIVKGQIDFPINEFNPPPGTNLSYLFRTIDSTEYQQLYTATDPGTHWDLTPLISSLDPDHSWWTVDPSTAPRIDSFPRANLVVERENDVFGKYGYAFFESTDSSLTELGHYSDFGTTTSYVNWDNGSPQYLFPMALNDSWLSWRLDTTTIFGSGVVVLYDSTWYEADAWGDLELHGKSAPCLRIKQLTRYTSVTYVSGSVAATDSYDVHSIRYVTTGFNTLAILEHDPTDGLSEYNVIAYPYAFDTPTDITENPGSTLPDGYSLAQNYPNPFNPTTDIQFTLPRRSDVTISIFNTLGQKITTLVDRTMPAGSYTVDWDSRNAQGNPVASGVYLYRLSTDGFTETKKMMLLK